MTAQNGELLPQYRVIFLWDDNDTDRADNTTLNWMIETMRLMDKDLISRFVRDEKNPDYIIVSDKCFTGVKARENFTHYLKHNQNSVFIFFTYEVFEPDLNIFDYAFTWNFNHICGDRIIHNFPYMYDFRNEVIFTNDITRENARLILQDSPRFCNFIYSHPCEVRDKFFHILSEYKHIDSLGSHLNNSGVESTRKNKDWLNLSINLKSGYKFSIAMENTPYNGYTTEKIVTSLQAHTIPIYLGDPAVAEFINPKAFINISDYSSLDEAIERVKEIDNNDELWLDMVTQPWQTEEQRAKTLEAVEEYNSMIRNIFIQDIKNAKRVPHGTWADLSRKYFYGYIPPLRLRMLWKIRKPFVKLMPKKLTDYLKTLKIEN